MLLAAGEDWGENGYFRTDSFLAGEDSQNVESLSASGLVRPLPSLLRTSQKVQIQNPGASKGADDTSTSTGDKGEELADLAIKSAIDSHHAGRKKLSGRAMEGNAN